MNYETWTKSDLIAEIEALHLTINKRVQKNTALIQKQERAKTKELREQFRQFFLNAANDMQKEVDQLYKENPLNLDRRYLGICMSAYEYWWSKTTIAKEVPEGVLKKMRELRQEINQWKKEK